MTSKTHKFEKIRISIIYFFIAFLPLLLCAGCKESSEPNTENKEYEIKKEYQRGPLTVHMSVDKAKVTIAETLLLQMETTIEPDYKIEMPKVGINLQNFGIVDWENLGDKLDENNNVVSRYRYRLEPFLSGTFQLPAFTFAFYEANSTDNKYELITEPIDIDITSLLGEQRDELKIANIEAVMEIPAKSSYWWAWGIGAVCFFIAFIMWLYLRRKRVAELVRIFKPAHEIAYERLRALVKENLVKKGKIKEFYERISDILRHYIEHRFNLRAPERTTEEFLIELATTDVLGAADRADLGEFLKLSDLVKFAKHNPTTEQIQKTFDLVKNFIEKTKSDENKIDVTEQMIEAEVA